MNRIEAKLRPTPFDGHLTYDIPSVWPDGHKFAGVVHASWLVVSPADTMGRPDGVAAKLRIWIPGDPNPGKPHTLEWGKEFGEQIRGFGMATVVSTNDVPLHVLWVLTPGKAPSTGGPELPASDDLESLPFPPDFEMSGNGSTFPTDREAYLERRLEEAERALGRLTLERELSGGSLGH